MKIPSIIDFKGHARAQATLLRKEAKVKQPNAGSHAASYFMRDIDPPVDVTVALYVPFGAEMDTWPLAEALAYNGSKVCLPVVVKKDAPLIFRLYEVDTPLVEGAYGIKMPPETSVEVIPDIVVTPLLGFKRDGSRLGMGGGFYDRTFEQLRQNGTVSAVGFAYALQEIKSFSAEKHDQPLDWIVTEREVIEVGGQA